MESNDREFLARFARAVIEYVEATRSLLYNNLQCERSERKLDEFPILQLLDVFKEGDAHGELLRQNHQKNIEDGDAVFERKETAQREVTRLAMLLDGASLSEIDAHFREEDAAQKRLRRELEREIERTLDNL
jgi:hypothetical protein